MMKVISLLILILIAPIAQSNEYCVIGHKTKGTTYLESKNKVEYNCIPDQQKVALFSVSVLNGLDINIIASAENSIGAKVKNIALLIGDMRSDLDPDLIELVTFEMRMITNPMSGVGENNSVLILYDNDPMYIKKLNGLSESHLTLKEFDADAQRNYLNSF